MPDPPTVNPFTRHVLESPWLLAAGLVLIGGATLFFGLREGRRGPLLAGVAALLLAGAVFVASRLVTTSGEHGQRLTHDLVDAAIAGDVPAVQRLLASDATLHFGSTRNVGMDLSSILDRLERLHRRFTIERNDITSLDGYSASADAAEVHVSCWTEGGAYGPTPSRWVVRVERQPDGSWRAARITCVSIGTMTPSPSQF